MRKFPIFIACFMLILTLLSTASAAAAAIGIIGGADGPTAVYVASASAEDEDVSPTPSPTPQPTAAPVENLDFTIEASLGYEGLVIMSRWSPAFVTVTNNGEDFDGILGVNVFFALTEYDRYEIPLTLASGTTKRVVLPLKAQMRQDMYAFELVRNGEIIAEQRVAPKRLASPETMTIGLLSDDPESLAYLNLRANNLDTLRGEVWMGIPLTAETFPESSDLMSAFSMLVVDGIDVRTLSETQQQALSTWLLKGGLVFVSGGADAANGYPFFSTWTNLSAGKLTEAEDITPALLDYSMVKGKAVGESVWLSPLPKKGAVIATEDTGLVAMHRAGEGMIFTAAFDMGGKPLANWSSIASFWPRALRQMAPQAYQKAVNNAEQSRYYGDDGYRAQELINYLRVPNDESGVPVMIILIAYVLVVGLGGYLLLKKLDKREWLWVTAPATAIVFALLLFFLSRTTTMNKPVTLTASRVLLEGEDAQVSTYIGVATPDGGEMTIETDQNKLASVYTENSYYDDSALLDRLFRPTTLRQRYRLGDRPAVGFTAKEAWDIKMLSLSGMETSIGALSTTVWMEADGLHGEIANSTEYTLDNCAVVSSFGFCKIDEILPGQTVEFAMLYPKKPVDQTSANFKYEPNVLYSTLDLNLATPGAYYDSSLYNYLNLAIYKDPSKAPSGLESQRMALVQLFERDWSFYENRSAFYFFGFNDSLGRVGVDLNGKAVTRNAHTAVLGSRITFEPIGPTGQVMFPQGLIPAEIVVDEGEDKKPRLPTDADGDTNGINMYGSSETYLNLGAPAALRFVLPEWGTYTIDKMILAATSYNFMPDVYLYNHEDDVWDAQKLMVVSMSGEDWAPYINDDGELFARYVPADGANRYDGIQMPSIALKGEVKEK